MYIQEQRKKEAYNSKKAYNRKQAYILSIYKSKEGTKHTTARKEAYILSMYIQLNILSMYVYKLIRKEAYSLCMYLYTTGRKDTLYVCI
jgi:hypothetical protein